jgi:hypothetical protein
LKAHPNGHFHWRSDYAGEGGLGDLEVYVAAVDTSPNLTLESV